jgi:hypothetical protein
MWPDTSMSMAFLDALVEWTARHVKDSTATVVLPVGTAKVVAAGQVLRALDRGRADLHPSEPLQHQ